MKYDLARAAIEARQCQDLLSQAHINHDNNKANVATKNIYAYAICIGKVIFYSQGCKILKRIKQFFIGIFS